MNEYGEHSGVRIVEIDLCSGLPHPTDVCIACGSRHVRVIRTTYPSVNFLEPIRGAPYPTYGARWAVDTDCICRDCGAHWGNSDSGDPASPEDLPYRVYGRKRIDHDLGGL